MKKLLVISVITLLFACQRSSEERKGSGVFKSKQKSESKKEDASPATDTYGWSTRGDTVTIEVGDANAATMFDSNGNTQVSSALTSSASEKKKQFISSTAAVETGKDTSRKFIRTAEIKFKVKNVADATYAIEDIIVCQGGFVASTNLTSNRDKVEVTSVSADSSVESTYFTVVNDLVLRVPATTGTAKL